jgi:HK97 family phage portal protein
VTVVVSDQGQVLRTSEGRDLVSGGPFLKSLRGRNAIARPSIPFGMFGSSGLTLIDGRTISYAEIYRTQPWVAAAVNVLARQISRLPLKVYELNSQNERERVSSGDPLVDLIQHPAPRCGATQLKQWMAFPALLHGNSTLLESRPSPGRPPNRLWPLDWRCMAPYFDRGEPIRFWRTTEFGTPIPLAAEDVFHLRWEGPDPNIGVSPLEQLGVTVRIERSAQDYQESYLRQGARPPSAIRMPQDAGGPEVVVSKELRAEMRADIEEAYAGSQNAGRPAFLPGGFEWVSIAHSAHEAELIEQRKLSREEVASVFEVPQPLVGILEHATYSNVAELHRMLYTTVLGPWLTLIEESFKAQIIDPEPAFQGRFVEFDLAEVLKGDKVKEINALKIAVQSGLMTINEARVVQNLPRFDLEWCNQPLIPSNNLSSSPAPEGATSEGEIEAMVERLISQKSL